MPDPNRRGRWDNGWQGNLLATRGGTAEQKMSCACGASYLRPLTIKPRIARFGAKFEW